jgi:pseudaminic acid cytidylyltransferase
MDIKKTLAVITARGGSKRIPRKNIKSFCGEPIIKYSIEAAIKSSCFDEIMVSTDDEEIAKIAISYGAKVPFYRSEENSNDYAITIDVIKEVIKSYKEKGIALTHLCCIYPTAPLIRHTNIQKGYQLLTESNADFVIPVTKFSYPIQRALQISDNKVEMIAPENVTLRSQDLRETYHDCGQFYWMKTQSIEDGKQFFIDPTIPLILPESEVQDIDTMEDWKIAETKYALLKEKAV